MRKIHLSFILAGLFAVQPVFADTQDMTSDSKPCMTIANACLDAGFTRADDSSKKFWQDCMKPIVMGKNVSGVSIDANTVKSCRTNKIAEMKKELKELQNVNS